ncbi:LysR family transcriptional regulator [Rosenbergiella australiborealis]|uniref:LysR family transcriptional regulator n=1 Tax=Rosenbergiella australiborealis TaxID=1544696 RepID=A0ABS5T875_9GAMM|nr:LysR family transcriptional regulator [Rosenbergiella australiborealis]MBT0727622.1 LysR family transcriptional regulator [Rosenbergiella australiborealis]
MHNKSNQLSEYGKRRTSPTLNWDDARVFLAIAREGTLSRAAKRLNLGIATLSRRLERLESVLQIRLFARDQQGYTLTDEGRDLISPAEALEQAGFAFGDATYRNNDQVMGHVRLATAQGLADYLIIPALPKLIADHPNLTMEIVTSVSTVNLHRRDADIALRMVRPERGNVSIRQLGSLGFGLYASQHYIDNRKGSDTTRLSFEHDEFIGWSELQQSLPAAQWLTKILRGRSCRLTTTNLSAQLSAVEAGVGMAILPHFISKRNNLVCMQEDVGCDQPIWLAIHSDLAHSRRVRAVVNFLETLISENETLLS